ncbi:uncharacterized protein [Mytilus edulis]|uniref:Autophagy-related protein 27 n=2 Tax=Mytilus galloprovincialis TaxID=29158 RepID=A0A8B6GYN2_MYTGA|nr:1,2-dihydroxy-3-keto-5-methylthiopentene dioxygenase [Mytilus galloprovincialis]
MKMTHYSLFCLLFVVSLLTERCYGFTCVKVNSCKCKLDDGTVIDLSPLGLTSGNPKYKDVPDAGAGDVFSYNPCYSFTENACNDVSVCQIRNGAGFSAGTQDSARFQYDEQNGLALVYSATSDVLRTTYTYLQCEPDQEGALNVLGEIVADGNYYLYLASKYACPTKDTSGSSGGGGLSGGSILLIIVVVLLFVYLIGGLAFQTAVKKAEGTDRIPNLGFWVTLPGLIKEGFSFTFNTAKLKAGYSSI